MTPFLTKIKRWSEGCLEKVRETQGYIFEDRDKPSTPPPSLGRIEATNPWWTETMVMTGERYP